MALPRISVLMTAYNVEPYVGAAIESILAQSVPDFELLVLDDRSSDATGAVIARHAASDSRMRIVPTREKGRVPGLNTLLAEARAPWIAIMDSDDIALPDRFEKQLAFLDAHPECGVLGGVARNIDASGTLLAPPSEPIAQTHEAIVADKANGIPMRNPTAMIARDLLQAVGGWRRPFRFAQDYDLYLRLHTLTRLANLPDTLLHYRIHPQQVSTHSALAQTHSAMVAWLSCEARLAGRADPLDTLGALPAIGTLDALFGVSDADARARRAVIERILYAPERLAADGLPIAIAHTRDPGGKARLARVPLRLARAGHPLAALRLGLALARPLSRPDARPVVRA
ncbi:glycosyltransferase [Novosphingobium sp. 1949]|uniref:Glycosyltransferase n=1 Tax=Novosphingobium organovorum TaxID=2930092 RepID=A0ABT0BFI5_9SPHN|nr:glycosyltransferase [Novosphingobium organovorum]MCJ2183837.1 glycosyltransferase [Novosphingobium organovorum]